MRVRAGLQRRRWGTILGYHDVVPNISSPHHVSVPVFDRQMERLSRSPLVPTPLSATLESPERSQAPHRVMLTFDDAKDNFLEHAFPTLDRFNLPCVLYAPTTLLGKPGHLGRDDLVQLAKQGVEIGSHSRSHRPLTTLSPVELTTEARDSKAELEDLLGVAVRHFSYPYGDCDERVRDAVRLAGYESGVLVDSGRITQETDRLLLRRSWPSDTMTLRWFEILALGHGDFRRLELPRTLTNRRHRLDRDGSFSS
jgi:peptidoglycan/xylan/chitin deacetylase (PgdA/CDA1 family)